MPWTDEQRSSARYYEGTCTSIPQIAEQLDLDEEETEDLMLDADMEECEGCGWWFRSHDLIDDEDNTGYCEDCRDDH